MSRGLRSIRVSLRTTSHRLWCPRRSIHCAVSCNRSARLVSVPTPICVFGSKYGLLEGSRLSWTTESGIPLIHHSFGTSAIWSASRAAEDNIQLHSNDAPPAPENPDSLMDTAGEMNLRCSYLDEEGNWTAETGTFQKSELCRVHGLDSRDLHNLDSPRTTLVPVILARQHFILVSILNFRALIKPNRVVVFQSSEVTDSEVDQRLKRLLQLSIRSGSKHVLREGKGLSSVADLPYEHRALDSILTLTIRVLQGELHICHSLVQQLLLDLEKSMDEQVLRNLLSYSKRMSNLRIRARSIKRAADEVLSNDEDLAMMYITSTSLGQPHATEDHVQLEFLFESFTKQVEEVITQTDRAMSEIQATQEVAELTLDSVRNSLMDLDIKIGVSTLSVGTGALIAGVFGMNLTSDLESTPSLFYITTAALVTVAGVIWTTGFRVLRRLRHVSLAMPARAKIDLDPLQPQVPRDK